MVFSVATGVWVRATGVWVRARAVLVTSAVTTEPEVGEAVTGVTAGEPSTGIASVLGTLLEWFLYLWIRSEFLVLNVLPHSSQARDTCM